MIRRALRAVALFLGLPCAAGCGTSRAFICQIDGVDVLDVRVPAEIGRLEVKRVEAYLESRNGKALVAGCEAAR
ncbi:MAG: hypothetical protein EBR30_27760 [Cytophagia bacterium]|nr:hypothetical protein [Cytophagia bacterium]NBW38750.1 hypothetical protein [Cytophagia bacterium]